VVTLEIKQTISCNAKNPFGKEVDSSPADGQRDESQDGIVVAHVMGGTKFLTSENNGLPYIYEWKKLQPDNTWKDLTAVKDSIAANLSHGNYALNIKDRNGIVLGTYDVNNALIAKKDSIQFMKEPAIFAISTTKGDVYCNGGIDGWATATVTGGTTPYRYSWSNGETISENTSLKAGDYSVVINDGKKCIVKDKVTISEPTAPISLNYTSVLNPSFYKATNGKIVVEVKGGTPFADKSYGYEWKNSAGVIQTATSQVNNGVYTLTLNDLPEDIYSLTIKDANYVTAGSKMGCTIINSTQTLDDPDPLKVTFEVQRTISCNVSNEFGNEIDTTPNDGQRDESQDGILMAHVSGGIPLDANQNNGLPYFYTWKKQLANGSWVIWNDHDETSEYLSNGIYALNIEDKNGIKLGTYVNNILTKEVDVTQPMQEPAKLVLTFTKLDVGCTVGNDGWANANVTGGTAPYTYQWTNEATTDKIENLTTNNYFVIVTDAKGCSVQGSIFVGDPNGILATETTKNPSCFQGNDGFITLDVKGGNLPYTYKWNTGATTKDLTQLKAGNYEVAITCPDCCVYKKYFTLKDPSPIVVNLGLDRTLCSGQSLDVDATILDAKAQYSWTATNGFNASTSTVQLTKAGIYNVKVTSELGCIGEDAIEIKTNNVAIQSEFLLSSQAYLDEEVILVNTSNPFGENTQWIIPENVTTVAQMEKFITLKFNTAGVYTIALKQTQGDCYALYSKNISVETRSAMPNTANTNTQFINDFIVSPNPNDGNFNALINLENSSPINLRLFSYNGQYTLIQKKDSGKKNYAVDFNVKLASGMYVLVLETTQQTLVKKIIIY
jgi:F420-0:gamma-glutamyl ligase